MIAPLSSSFSGFVRLNDPARLPESLAAPVIAIGNFDGVHRGHKAVFERAKAHAKALRRPAAALTFNPHPRAFFQPGALQFRLTPPDVQAGLMAALGLDGLIVLGFDKALSSLTAEDFVDDVLVGRLGVSGIVAGADFHFGKGRSGSPATLIEAGKRSGFVVEIVDQLASGEAPVSSSRIREALAQGRVAEANALLGYDWFVRGMVIHGQKLGRTLGFPTANLALEQGCGLRHGIYAVRVTVAGRENAGVASFGRRPTFDNGLPLLEAFLFDFAEDLYGKTIDVAFVAHLRDELKFDSAEALVAQMQRDASDARQILSKPKSYPQPLISGPMLL